MKAIAILLLAAIQGCTFLAPINECRVSILDGKGRTGSLTQYVKGNGQMIRIVQVGKGCENVRVMLPGVDVTVN